MEKKANVQQFFSKIMERNSIGIIVIIILLIALIGLVGVDIFIRVNPGNTTTLSDESLELFNEGKKKYLEQNLEESIRLFKELVSKNKKFSNGYFMLGKAYFFNDQRKEAKATWEQSLGVNPDHINSLVWLGILYHYEDKTGKAISMFNKALDLDGLNLLANYYLAKIYFNQKEYKKAIFYFNNALENENHLAEVHIDMAKMFMELDLADRAYSELHKAKELTSSTVLQDEIRELLKEANKQIVKNKTGE